jgi:hypothetical protein
MEETKMILIILVILAAFSHAAWWLGFRWAARHEEMLDGKGLLIDVAGILISALAAMSSWGYLALHGDPIPKELIPSAMAFSALVSAMMVYVSLCVTFTHLLRFRVKRRGGGGGQCGVMPTEAEGTEKPVDSRSELRRMLLA